MPAKLLIISLTVLLIFTAGCSEVPQQTYQTTPTSTDTPTLPTPKPVKTISISGIDGSRTIASSQPLIIVISGINNQIKIQPRTEIKEIIISGTDNQILLPEGTKTTITDSGIRNQVEYYTP